MVPLVPEPEPGLLPDLVLAAGYRFWLEAVEQLRILDMDTCRHTIDQLASVLGIQVMLDMMCSIGVKSAANRLIGKVVQSRRRPLLGPSPG